MGYGDPLREAAVDAGRDLLEAAVVLGAHLDAPEDYVDDEMIARALCAFMDVAEKTSESSTKLLAERGEPPPLRLKLGAMLSAEISRLLAGESAPALLFVDPRRPPCVVRQRALDLCQRLRRLEFIRERVD